MRSLVHVAVTFVVILTNGGCSSTSRPTPSVQADAPVQTAQAAQAVASPCIAVVSGANLSSWQTVAGDGFTFCVPANWHGRCHNWRSTVSTLEWGTGKARGQTVKVVETRVVSKSELGIMFVVAATEIIRLWELGQAPAYEHAGGRVPSLPGVRAAAW